MKRVFCLIVTHNRLDKLKNCLSALSHQSYSLDSVIVVDNASTDATQHFLSHQDSWPFTLLYERLPHNIGGAGGFAHGLALFLKQDAEAIWLMDDDSLPRSDALLELLNGMSRAERCGCDVSIAASQVIWLDGNLHPWNIPQPRLQKSIRDFTLIREGLLPIRSASFVSILLKRQAVERYGLPVKDYFIYNDDIEYTGRILRHDTGVLCPASVCVHDTSKANAEFILPASRLFFEVRNKLWMIIYSPAWTARERTRYVFILVLNILLNLKKLSTFPAMVCAVARGLWHALLHKPKG